MKHLTGGLAALVLIASAVPGVAMAAPTDTTGPAGGTGLDLAQSRAHYTPGDHDYWTQPNQSHRANAAKHRLSGYQALSLRGEAAKQAIKRAISASSPVPIGMQIRQSFNDVSPQNPGTARLAASPEATRRPSSATTPRVSPWRTPGARIGATAGSTRWSGTS
ncbi:hypothetical protein GCM10027030_32040 [Luteococcus sediminum]